MGLFSRKKGGSSHTPVEAKETGRSFQILRMLEVISEGEIEGLVDDMKSVYLDKTPLCNADGTFNFKNVSVYANVGTQDQDVLPEFNSVEKEINVGSKILKNKPIIKTVTDVNVTRIRMTLGVERLLRQEDNGDTNPTSVSMTIEILKNNSVVGSQTYTFNGKYSNAYREMFDLTVPQPPFSIRVSRVEPDSLVNKVQNTCFWSSYTEIIDKEFAYPNTALIGIKIDSEYFSNVPVRNYEINGLIIKVPSNYNPETHTYTSDFWDGSFKSAWSNNPAWVFYDLVTNTRYGMGKRLQEFNIDKWQLYAIGRYCDELVPDGFGGKEPRMTCNIWITDQRKAYDLINDICSIFRAMPVWNGQALTAIQDRKADPVWTYNNSNTIGGFTRQRSARKARHNTIQVEYIDASDFYEKKIESVSDDTLVARYGENVKKITAFGCTSRGQAYRTGRWLLETEKLETETITFTVGQEGVMHLPYDIIEIADSQYAGVNVGGRVWAVNGTQLTLDRSIEIDDNSYLSYVSAKGITENVKIVSFNKQNNVVTVAKNLNGIPELTVWGLTTKRITTGLYRAISIKENDNANGKTYTITALQHVPEKEDIVINGTHFDPKPQTVYGDVVDAEIAYDGSRLTVSGKVNGSFNVLSSRNITSYTVKLLKNNSLVYIEKGLQSPDINVDNLENGAYEAEISAYNDKNQLLSQYTKRFTIDRPPLVTGISVTGHLSSVILTWALVDEITQTEIWCSTVDDINTASLVERIVGGYYAHEIGSKQVRYYWLRHKRGVNVGKFDQTQGRKGESGVNVQAELELLNKELSKNIISEIIDTALPARKLGMTLSVSNLDVNTYQGQKQVYDETSNKSYTWNGTKYVPVETELFANKIKGIIQPSQLAPIPTTNLAGKLTDEQISQISATKLIGTIKIAQVPSIPTNKLTGLLTDAQVQSISATKINGTLDISKVPAIPTSKLTGIISDAQLEAVSANKISGVLDITKVPTIPTTKLGGQISEEQIQSVSASKIAGVIDLSKVPSIPTTKLSGKISDTQLVAVSASKISGTIDLSKVPNVPTTKLTGTISAEQIAVNAIGTNHLASNVITSEKIKAGAIDAQAIATDAITAEKIKANEIGANHIASNAITSDKIMANSIIATKIATGAIETRNIKANAIGTNHIASNQITAEKIRAGTLTAREIASNAITSEKINANAITAQKIASDAVETQHIKANAVTANQLNANAVTAEKILSGAITSDKIMANAIIADKIASNAITTTKIATNAITAQKIAGDAIESNHIKAGSIIAGKLASNSIVAGNIATDAVIARNIKAGSIEAEKLAVNSVGANVIQAGAILTDHLHSNSITSGKIQAGAISASHLQAGQISADKLAIGLGGNLLYNPIFANNAHGWRYFNNRGGDWNNCPETRAFGRGYDKSDYHPKGEQTEEWRLLSISGTQAQFNTLAERGSWVDICRQFVNVVADRWYIVSAYVGGFHCAGQILVEKYNADENQYLGLIAETPIAGQDDIYNKPANFITAYSGEFAKGLQQGARRIWVKFKAPNTGKISLVFRINRYAKNQTYGDFYLARPMLQECTEYATQPNEWQNAGVTSIHGGSIVTGTITADKIGANQITANHIIGGAINGEHIAGNTITGNKIQSGAIQAGHITVSTLSSLSANLGSITGGAIKIGSMNGNYGTLFEVNPQGGFRLISRDSSGGIELSSATRALTVWDGVNEVVKVGRL